MAGHELPQPGPISAEQSAGHSTQLSRRTLLRRGAETGAAVAAVAVAHNLWLPHTALGAQKEPTVDQDSFTADQRLSDVRRKLSRLERAHPSRLPDVRTTAEENGGVTSFGPGTIIYKERTKRKVVRARWDDGWDQAEVAAAFAMFEGLGTTVDVYPVGQSVLAYPDDYRRGQATGRIRWHNHTDDHSDLTPFTKNEVIDHVIPQSNALRSVLRRPIEELTLGTPYGAGTLPGQRDGEIIAAAIQLKLGLDMWNKDTLGWNGASVEEAVDNLLPLKPGDRAIFHFTPVDRAAFKVWAKEARRLGYSIEPVSTIPHSNGMGL